MHKTFVHRYTYTDMTDKEGIDPSLHTIDVCSCILLLSISKVKYYWACWEGSSLSGWASLSSSFTSSDHRVELSLNSWRIRVLSLYWSVWVASIT